MPAASASDAFFAAFIAVRLSRTLRFLRTPRHFRRFAEGEFAAGFAAAID